MFFSKRIKIFAQSYFAKLNISQGFKQKKHTQKKRVDKAEKTHKKNSFLLDWQFKKKLYQKLSLLYFLNSKNILWESCTLFCTLIYNENNSVKSAYFLLKIYELKKNA